MKRSLILATLAVVLSACGPGQEELRAAAEAAAAQKEQAAAELEKRYDEALASQKWEMARIHGAALLQQYPDTKAAAQVRQTFDDTQAKAEAKREADRLSSLWNYAQVQAGKGVQRSATIYSRDTVDVDGSGPRTVQLVFRDHPSWGRSAYLVLLSGDFKCYGGCKVRVSGDGGAAKAMDAFRPKTDEAIAMFVTDRQALWNLARRSKTLEIEFPTRDVGTKKAVFETGGLNPARMPGWD